ncbi:MAG: hypothetical protein QOI57_2897 [Rubrobacteraceae bacterium]|nr:hypothetical protein [Rubrobacteraceae bacterium]
MSAEENKAVLDELVAPDVFNHSAAPEYQRGIEGFKYVNKWVLAAVPNVHYAIEGMIAEGGHGGVSRHVQRHARGRVVGPPTGKRFSVEHVHWHRLADGKLVERWGVRDDLGMMQQLGVISAPEQ